MRNPTGLGIAAILATATLAVAGGGEGEKKNARTLDKLSSARQGASVSAAAGEGFTITAGDEFSLNVTNRVQVLWRYANFDGDNSALQSGADTNNFSVPQARTRMQGNVWDENMTYAVSLEWGTGGGLLRDAWFNWDFWSDEGTSSTVGFRVGSQKPGFGREATGSQALLEHTARSAASRVFSSNNRVLGAFLRGSHGEGGKFHWHAGMANGDVAGASGALEAGNVAFNPDNETDFYFGVRIDPMGDMGDEWFSHADLEGAEELKASLGAGLQIGNHRTSAAAADVETLAFNVNGVVRGYGFQGIGEFFWRNDDRDSGTRTDALGFAIGGSYVLPPTTEGGSQWGGAVRYSFVDLNDSGTAQTLLTRSAVGAMAAEISELNATISHYYKKHKLKTQLGYTWQNLDPSSGNDVTNHFFDILFQWWF